MSPSRFGVALWERYNRLILLHSAGMPVLVTRYDDLVHDAAAWSEADQGVPGRIAACASPAHDRRRTRLSGSSTPNSDTARTPVPTSSRPAATALALYDALEAVVGPSSAFVAPELPPEPGAVAAELDTVGPATELAWHPPPWAQPPGRRTRLRPRARPRPVTVSDR